MEIKCKFHPHPLYLNGKHPKQSYQCSVVNQFISEHRELIFAGKHQIGKSNYDVTTLTFHRCVVTKIPQGLRKSFPNLKNLFINFSRLKSLNRIDMFEYKYLERFDFSYNDIQFLPGDLFEGFINLEEISFYSNNLRVVEPNLLDGLDRLRLVNFKENPNYNMCCYNDGNLLEDQIDEVKQHLFEAFYSRYKYVQELRQSMDELYRDVQNLKSSNRRLSEKNENLKKSEENMKILLESNNPNAFASLQFQKGLAADLVSITRDNAFKDFKVIIDDHVFNVHKFVLAARSTTLAEMLRQNPGAENLKLVDISVEIFDIVLNYIYTGELPSENSMNYSQIYAAANRLKLEDLKIHASQKMCEEINVENAFEALKVSNATNNDIMRQKAFNEIQKLHPNIVLQDHWARDDEKLIKIIEAFKKKEDIMKKAEEEYNNLIMENIKENLVEEIEVATEAEEDSN